MIKIGKIVPVFVVLLALAGFAAALDVKTRTEHPPEMNPFTCFDVQSDLGRFTFRPPPEWRLEVIKSGEQLRLVGPAGSGSMEISFHRAMPDEPTPDSDSLRRGLASRFDDLAIIEEQTCYASSRSGPGWYFDWSPRRNVKATSKLAVVAFDGGTVEFLLTCSRDRFAQANSLFGAVLTSFAQEIPQSARR